MPPKYRCLAGGEVLRLVNCYNRPESWTAPECPARSPIADRYFHGQAVLVCRSLNCVMGLLPGWFMRMGCLRFCPHLPLVRKLTCVDVSPTTRVSSPLGITISHLTTLPDPPATLSIRSLVQVRLHRLLPTIGGKVVNIDPPSLSHEIESSRHAF